jgi:steroid delta-isomerase-like uncharacterized protein
LLVVSAFAFETLQASRVVSAQTDTKALAQAWVDAQNAAIKSGDSTALLALYSPDYTDPMAPAGTNALDAVKQNIKDIATAFPDGKLEVKDIVASSDEAAVYTVASGTNKGPFQGVPPTGKPFSNVNIIDILTFKNGKIVKDVSVADLSLLLQIGWNIVPPGGGTMQAPTPAK